MAENGKGLIKGEVHALMAFSEEQRDKYCIETILAIAEGAEKIALIKGRIPQMKAAKKFMADLRAKKSEILPPIIYTIKPQFRETYMELLERFSEIFESSAGKK